MLEEFDEDEEDENFKLYLSDDEKFDNLSDDIEKNLLNGNTDSILFTQEELCESSKLQITERVLIHDSPRNDRILTRSQVKDKNIDQEKSFKNSRRNKDEIEEIENRNDPPGKESDTEMMTKTPTTTNDKEKSSINDKENQIPRIKPNITQAHKKKGLCWSTDHTYPLYFEPLNKNLTSILPQHVRVFF